MTPKSIQNTAQLRGRLLVLCVLLVGGVGVAAGLLGVVPLHNRLTAQALSELEHQLDLQRLIVDSFHQRLVGLGLQVGSRTQARQELTRYNQGEIDLATLVSLNTPKLADALRQAPDLLGMVRLDRQGQAVVRLGKPLEEGMWPSAGGAPAQVVFGRSGVDAQGTEFLTLRTPIIDGNKQLQGTDLFLCSFASLRERLAGVPGLRGNTRIFTHTTNGWQSLFTLAGTEDGLAAALTAGNVVLPGAGEERTSSWWTCVHGTQEFVVLARLMPVDWLLVVGQDKTALMGAANRILLWVGIAYVVLLLLGLSGVVLLLRPLTGRLLVHQQELGELVEEQARALMHVDATLREKTLFLDSILCSSINMAIVAIDHDMRVHYLNPLAEEMFDMAAERVAGADLRGLHVMQGVTPQQMEQLLQEVHQRGECSFLVSREHGDTTHLLSARVSSITTPDGRQAGYVLMARDITEERRLEQEKELLQTELLQAQKLESVGRLAAGIAHEINTPIQYVVANTEFFEESFASLVAGLLPVRQLLANADAEITPQQLQAARDALQAADWDYLAEEIPRAIAQSCDGLQRISSIVLAMKEFSHPGGKEKQEASLNRIIETTITVARSEWKYVAEVETDLAPDLPLIPCLVDEMGQVVLNMLVNAAQAIAESLGGSPEGAKGRIAIKTRCTDKTVILEISDTGCGIPPEIQEKIFDPFFTTKEVGKGTGQGLTIAHDVIVNKHGGTIHLTSESGKGTTFHISLPRQS
ncbi:MAG: hypothetical protein BWK76_01605 [Desulfobulbaceae bacterium A2]|nr:MAG: hypothetical protein BWK76_01605 [Desulfobulbaceae bacterium A2]